jgi:ABC-type transport system involved in multi-copper enzyme maturation permease subunit
MENAIKIENIFIAEEERLSVKKIGTQRYITQVIDTFTFEIQRNLKKFFIVLALFIAIIILMVTINQIQEDKGIEPTDDPLQYARGYLGFIDMLIYISASTFAGSLIVVDFEKQTGNMIFPIIARNRLLIGRVLSVVFMNGLCVLLFYITIGIITYVKYDEIPEILWTSMGWAELYTLTIIAFVTFFSSVMKTTAGAVVVSIILLIMVFNLVLEIGMLLTKEEPIYLLTYYAYIITYILDMPEERFQEMNIPLGTEQEVLPESITLYQWLTPDQVGAFWGMIIYMAILFFLSYVFFRKKNS